MLDSTLRTESQIWALLGRLVFNRGKYDIYNSNIGLYWSTVGPYYYIPERRPASRFYLAGEF